MGQRLIILILLLSIHQLSKAQHGPSFSQYLFNGLVINPAYAGSNEALTFTLSHRNQWAGIEGAPTTSTVGIHSILRNEKVGLGFLFYQDKFGITNNKVLNGSYAYRINTGKFKIALGLQLGAIFNKENWDEVIITNPNDVLIPSSSSSIRPTFGSGLYVYNSKFFAGISTPQLLSHKSSPFQQVHYYTTYILTAGYNLRIDNDIVFQPSILLKHIKNSSLQADFNGVVVYKNFITGGLSFRTREAVVFLLKLNIDDQFNFGYSYDHIVGKLANYAKGSHEITISYALVHKLKAKGARSF